MTWSGKVWLITGCSLGSLGRHIVESALARNDKVIATGRKLSSVQDLQSESCKVLQLDVDEPFSALQEKAKEAISLFGHVDVLVNNSGFGLFGSIEELGAERFMHQFQTNFLGVMNLTNAFLPHFRSRRDGTIVNIGSRSVWRDNVPFMGPYVTSKAALHGLTGVLAAEVAAFNVRVLLVQPGGLRTGAWRNARNPLDESTTIHDYDELRDHAKKFGASQGGTALGDPVKVANVILDVVRGEGVATGRPWPGTLVLGEDAERDVRAKCEQMLSMLDEWKDVVRSTRVDEGAPEKVDFAYNNIK
ncbi:NAD(P)-binding protein [Punctularia strigosozonata HHB-11173 SS5]|uniref:NAD(P)-binding protein n=1 Tax=Punctularia strigosozonata (strain HHB-11173) TaxID=741275 RepID=UPI00044162DA|nr:NAD(P)-binding protein [Punctularia strigosozonata HHB-11173 SS5]EIN08928.1 NAD(P)-binding protein [Punctularia strigosozonata HHB-11173 SS5]